MVSFVFGSFVGMYPAIMPLHDVHTLMSPTSFLRQVLSGLPLRFGDTSIAVPTPLLPYPLFTYLLSSGPYFVLRPPRCAQLCCSTLAVPSSNHHLHHNHHNHHNHNHPH